MPLMVFLHGSLPLERSYYQRRYFEQSHLERNRFERNVTSEWYFERRDILSDSFEWLLALFGDCSSNLYEIMDFFFFIIF